MHDACNRVSLMSKLLQVRGLDDDVHRRLAERARARGQTLSRYVAEILSREAARRPFDEVIASIESRGPVRTHLSGAKLVRESREEEDARWDRLPPDDGDRR